MMDPDVHQRDDDLELTTEHDQLPNVEEYKAGIGYTSSPRKSGKRPDPDAHSGYIPSSHNDFIDATDEEDGNLVIQVPDSTEFHPKYESPSQAYCSPCFWKTCGICSCLILAAIVGTILYLANAEEIKKDYWHFLHGETDSYLAVRNYVTKVAGLSDIETLTENANTPQYYAAQWMAHGDGMKLAVPEDADPAFDERYAMVVLYFSLGGRGWTHQLDFLSADHVCAWYQEFQVVNGKDEELDQQYTIYGIHGCKKDNDGGELYPTAIYLPANGLNGTLPEEIRGLKRLEYLNIESNAGITGTLPSGMRFMDSLSTLMVQWCAIGPGPIPSWIGKLTSLNYLGLGTNRLTGSLPNELGDLTNLELLGLDNNQFDGNLEIVRPLVNLKSLYLDNNYLTGKISDEMMDGWYQMQELDVSDNVITGELPSNLLNHKNNLQLQVIDLHGNELVGSLPTTIDKNRQLEFLALHENKLEGDIVEGIANLEALRHLDISVNKFQGTLPRALFLMTNLEYLFVGENQLDNATIHSDITQLTNLRELSMKKSLLIGTIPSTFFHYLTNLQFLDFHLNNLVGEIPSDISKASDLRHLLLKMNHMTGTVPQSMGMLTNLEVLLLEQNKFIGDADAICSSGHNITAFAADCGAGNEHTISCDCCSVCCDASDALCNTFTFQWRGNLDPSWKYGYRRERYSYQGDIWTP